MPAIRLLTTSVALFAFSASLLAREDGPAAWKQGVAAFSSGKYEAAAGHFDAAEKADYERPSALYYLGLSLYHAGRYDEALRALRSAADIEPDFRDYVYHYYVGAAHYRRRLYRLAAEEMELVLSAHPDSSVAAKAREVLGAIASLPKPLPRESLAWYLAAAAKGIEAGDISWAEDYAAEAFRNAPDDTGVRALMARLCIAKGKLEEALVHAKGAGREQPVIEGDANLRLGRLADAVDAFSNASATHPQQARAGLLDAARLAKDRGDRQTLARIIALMGRLWPDAAETAAARRLSQD